MSIRGTRVFPPSGIRGAQGNQGSAGPSSYSISVVTIEPQSLGSDPITIEVIASLPTTGTIKFWGYVCAICTTQNRLSIIPSISSTSLTDFEVRQDYQGSSGCNTMAVGGESSVAEGDSLNLVFNFSAGTGTLVSGCIFYAIE